MRAQIVGNTGNTAEVASNGSQLTSLTGSNVQVYDGTSVWANSAPINTVVDKDITLPSLLQGDALYEIIVTNPSTVSDITVVVKNKETFNAIARYPELTRFGVVKNTDGKVILVQGWMLGEGGRLTLSNDTVLGVSDGFTAYVRVRKV